MPHNLSELQTQFVKLTNTKKAAFFPHFFKCGPGEYGEGDRFRGITVPQQRLLAGTFRNLTFAEIKILLDSEFHEDRLTALFILILQYRKGDKNEKERIHKLYVSKWQRVNNWDLVDSSAEHLMGAHVCGKNDALLITWAKSKALWQRRIAMIACYHAIKREEFGLPLSIAKLLLKDTEDLIHKAVGWMLREIGKRNGTVERQFLNKHAAMMPRTMLRYAIEKFPEGERKRYLNLKKG